MIIRIKKRLIPDWGENDEQRELFEPNDPGSLGRMILNLKKRLTSGWRRTAERKDLTPLLKKAGLIAAGLILTLILLNGIRVFVGKDPFDLLERFRKKGSSDEQFLRNEELLRQLAELERQSHLGIAREEAVFEGNVAKVVGEVVNRSDKNLYDIDVEVDFLNADRVVVDRKYGKAYGFVDVLASGESAQFETGGTLADFVTYELKVNWKEK